LISAALSPSYLYRFDAAAQAFFTIPLSNGAGPIGVAVTGTNPTRVWIAEYGLNRLRQVIFTDTTHYTQTVYPITSTANSGPYRVAVHGNNVWFTERTANRVGRLNMTTGQVDEFYGQGLSLNAGLSDIKVAPDGEVWIGGQTGRRLIRLTVNSPGNYAFTEYTDTLRPSFKVSPVFLAVGNSDLIWLTAPEVSGSKLAQFTPSSQDFVWPTLPTGSVPQGVAATPGYAWIADSSRHKIVQIEVGTQTLLASYGPVTSPVEIAAASPDLFWLTQANGAIARFVHTSTVSFQITSRALPRTKLQPTGLAVAADNTVWVAAYAVSPVYLPLVLYKR
jgi:streptogramin lyase